MIKTIKGALVSSLVACLVLATTLTANAAVGRYAGQNRYETANQIVAAGWDKADTVILTAGTSANLVDALTAAPLAKNLNAPVILVDVTDSKAVDGINAQLTKLGVKKVYIATGKGVISEENFAKKLVVTNYEYLGGKDRYETSANIAAKMGTVTKLVVAPGSDANLVDSLSIAPIAAIEGMPILLTENGSLNANVQAFVDAKKPATTYIVGNTIAKSIEDSLKAKRLGGSDRYATNAAILNAFKDDANIKFDSLFVASGADANLVDALAGSPLAAKKSAVVVLAQESANLSADTISYLKAKLTKTTDIKLFGGEGAVKADVASKLDELQKGIVDNVVKATIADVDNSFMGTTIVTVSLNATDSQNYTVNVKGQAAKYYADKNVFKVALTGYFEAKDFDAAKDVVFAKKADASTVKATVADVDNSFMGTTIVTVSLDAANPEAFNVTVKGAAAKYYADKKIFKVALPGYFDKADIAASDVVVAAK